ncbi:efflux transporter outer membrane subunit [Oceanobacter sp. 5_MG-2023]|uniref:efflux transporter outer membrane subunit n=1 Tax=Oceanobacter sp. 5_MG-2023 TaxID=3062645 RepID=UPI0026E36D04|nr:efflux transporter outer membrane subunit [Oceanobacter sp. 5_MG-2023]MDO6682014.1 efflux transporter outer membrane subunit [Oceanobacter sp. 5_MG-2023]
MSRLHSGSYMMAMKITALAAMLAAGGCAGPQRFEPEVVALPDMAANEQQTKQALHVGQLQHQWWAQLGSPQLNRLMDEAQLDNIDVRQALLRISKASAALDGENADLWPTLSASASASQKQALNDASGRSNSTGLNLSASYTVDLWQRRGTLIEQAELDVVAAEVDLASARITLQSNLVTQYLDWLSTKARLQLAQQNLQASREMESLVQIRFDAGDASGIEMAQQRNTTLSLLGSAVSLQQQLAVNQRALAALLGRSNLQIHLGDEHFDQLQIPRVASVQPAELLTQRPDIVASELALRQRHQDIYLAESDRWPSLSLSAGLSPADLMSLAGNWTLSLTEALSVTLFDAGSKAAAVAEAEVEEAVARLEYRRIVIDAMQETLDAMEAVDYERQQTELAVDTLENNQELLALADIRYQYGDTDFSDLLNAQRTFFNARDSLVVQRQKHIQALVELYVAFGVAPALEGAVSLDETPSFYSAQ